MSISALLLATLPFAPALTIDPAPGCESLDTLFWLIGEWASADGSSGETWSKASASTFEGAGQVGTEESLRLVEMSGEVFYLAKVGHNAIVGRWFSQPHVPPRHVGHPWNQ